MFTLALDCSTSLGSMALGRRNEGPALRVVRRAEFFAGRGGGGHMFTVLEEVMRALRGSIEDEQLARIVIPLNAQGHSNRTADEGGRLSEIIVGLGPGSYSGVRQAIAVATGLAAATGAVLHGVPSVAALPVGAEPHHVVGDARRGTFYYTAVGYGRCLVGPLLLDSADELAARVAENPDWPVYTVESALPDGLLPAALVSVPAADRLLAVPPAARQIPPLEPIYLRPVSITLPKPRPAIQP